VYLSPLTAEPSKTEAIWFGSGANRLADSGVTIRFEQASVHPSDCVRDLGVLLDSSLSIRQHIAKVEFAEFAVLSTYRVGSGWCARLF